MKIRPRLWNRTDPDRPKKCVSIMRPGLLGNPFIVGIHGTREQCIDQYERWVRYSWGGSFAFQRIGELDDVDLVCCCTPMPCHGDVHLKIWDELNG